MYVGIFNYIEHLFDMIKPKKLFFLSIDGVAPRAKMNQQRSRRFRTALDAELARKKATESGMTLPTDDPFDSNAITPGTEFMEKLTLQLKYFITRKVSEDSSWQGIDIVLSGHEVPGEGEHKIMEHIRISRAQPDYNSNTRHCLYGLDADLIMLGLLSHDPHFALLREEVTFGRQAKKAKELDQQVFQLLHLSLVREYMELEFNDVKDAISFPFDFEKVLDDFILINYFIGNDFLPELPSLLINEGALPIVFTTYKATLKQLDGYLSHEGVVNFQRLGVWLDEMTKFELERFEAGSVDVEWMNEELDLVSLKSQNNEKLALTPKEKELLRFVKPFILDCQRSEKPSDDDEVAKLELPDWVASSGFMFLKALAAVTYTRVVHDEGLVKLLLDVDGIPSDETQEERNQRVSNVSGAIKKYEKAPVQKEEELQLKKGLYSSKFQEWKSKYYKDKFHIDSETDQEAIKDIAENYLEGLQWVLFYYYRGIASWGWYYRYHYAPCISDVRKGLGKIMDFTLGRPFRPFDQLMGVLPERSKALVPPAYRTLMTDETSQIIDFYPRDFEIDMNGKKNEWEAVVKIPFVDEERLLKVLRSRDNLLTPAEKKRNSFGKNLKFMFNPQVDTVYHTSLPGVFLDLSHSHCIEVELEEPSLNGLPIRYGLGKDVKVGVEALAGFPSIKTIPFSYEIDKAGIQVFQQPSRNESIILTLADIYKDDSPSALAEELIDESIYIGWPYLNEAKVVALSDELFRYERMNGKVVGNPHSPDFLEKWKKGASRIRDMYYRKGVRVGDIRVLAHVKKLTGLKRTRIGAYVKEFSTADDELEIAVQTILENVSSEDERFRERGPMPIAEEFPIGSQAIYLGPAGYGNPVTITSHRQDSVDIHLMKLERPEPNFGARATLYESKVFAFYPSYEVSKMVQLHPLLLSKITSKYLVEVDGRRYDVGLSLKFEAKRLKVTGYSRRGLRGWEFSAKAVDLIRSYKQQFPEVFSAIQTITRSGIPQIDKILNVRATAAKAKLDEIRKWIKEKTVDDPQFVPVSLESERLSVDSIKKIEKSIISFLTSKEPVKVLKHTNIPREALLSPSHAYHQLRNQKFTLGDRVVSALAFGKVKLFNRGTIVAINSYSASVTLDVLFDQEFDAATTFGGVLDTKRGMTVDAGSIINLSERQLVFLTKKAMEQKQVVAKSSTSTRFYQAPIPPNPWKISAKPAAVQPIPVKGKNGTINGTPKSAKHPVKVLQKPRLEAKPNEEANPESNEEASQNLLDMLKGSKTEQKDKDPLKNIKKNRNARQSQRNIMGAVYSQFMPPPPPTMPIAPADFAPMPHPNGFSPFGYSTTASTFVPGVVPMSTMAVDEDASAKLMAELNIKDGSEVNHKIGSTHGYRRGRGGRGEFGGRGRGGRGRGRGD